MKQQAENLLSTNTAQQEQEKLAMKAVMLPLALGAVMTTPSYVLQLQRSGTPVMGAGIFQVISNSLKLLPTVTNKQVTRSAAGFASPKKGEEDQRQVSPLYPAVAAVSLESGLSGFTGMMAGLAKGKISKPVNVSLPQRLAWNSTVVAKHTPHTFGYTALASSANIIAMAWIKPLATDWSMNITSNPWLQTAAGNTIAAIGAGLITTPINTAGGYYLKALTIEQQGLNIKVTANKTFTDTTKEIFKHGSIEGVKALYKPLALTVGMTWLAFIAFDGVNLAVDKVHDCKQRLFTNEDNQSPAANNKLSCSDVDLNEIAMEVALTA